MSINNIYSKYIGRRDQNGRYILEGDKVEFTLSVSCGRTKHVFTGTVKRLETNGEPYVETDNWHWNYLLTDVARIKVLHR